MKYLLLITVITLLTLASAKRRPSSAKSAGLPDGWKKCSLEGRRRKYVPGETITIERCRTCLCTVNGSFTCSPPLNNRTCHELKAEGQCFGQFGANLLDGNEETRHSYNVSGSECEKCVCLGGKFKCVSRKCCLYTDNTGNSKAAYPGDGYHDGCNGCTCGTDAVHSLCTLMGCNMCHYTNWEGVPGQSEIGAEAIMVRKKHEDATQMGYCYNHCSCEKDPSQGGYFPQPLLKCPDSCVAFMK